VVPLTKPMPNHPTVPALEALTSYVPFAFPANKKEKRAVAAKKAVKNAARKAPAKKTAAKKVPAKKAVKGAAKRSARR